MLELKTVSFKYRNIAALENINVEVNKGDAIAVIGPNGSGKSTFLKLINGIVFPTKGKYIFNGEEITEKRLNDSRFSKLFHKRIGFVFQNSEAQLFNSSVYDEIAFGPMQMGLDKKEVEKRVEDCIKLLSIQNLKDRVPYTLSGGEKKKVAIGSVLALNPEVIVLDEPMNGLDPKTKRFLRELLIRLNQAGKTIICSTHDFQYVEGIFKRALVFSENHRIIRDDDYNTIINDNDFLEENNII